MRNGTYTFAFMFAMCELISEARIVYAGFTSSLVSTIEYASPNGSIDLVLKEARYHADLGS